MKRNQPDDNKKRQRRRRDTSGSGRGSGARPPDGSSGGGRRILTGDEDEKEYIDELRDRNKSRVLELAAIQNERDVHEGIINSLVTKMERNQYLNPADTNRLNAAQRAMEHLDDVMDEEMASDRAGFGQDAEENNNQSVGGGAVPPPADATPMPPPPQNGAAAEEEEEEVGDNFWIE